MLNRKSRAEKRQNQVGMDFNITPFMNLMVVLIPFLLSGVVFSRLAILEMKLPTAQAESSPVQPDKKPFRLIVTLREKGLTVVGTEVGRAVFPSQEGGYDLEGLADLLLKVKAQYPQEEGITLLSEPEIPYESLVSVMDACRENGAGTLFPEISIGAVKAI